MEKRSAEGKRGLDPKWYLDPSVFRYEMDHLFHESWVPIGHESQLPSAGSFFSDEVNGIPVVLVRESDEQVRAFLNVCQHRGTQLCHESYGQLKNKNLVCPYHGWKYDLQGNLVAAPNMNDVPGFSLDTFGLNEVELRSWNGMLFVYSPSLYDQVRCDEPIRQRDYNELLIEKLGFLERIYPLRENAPTVTLSYEVAANWKLIFQNFNECYHCPSVHPQLSPYSDYRESSNDFEAGGVLGGPMRIRDSADTISLDGSLCGALPSALAETERKHARYYTLFPNLFVSLFPDYVMVHRIRPVARDRTIIECDFLFHAETIQSPSFDPDKASRFWDLTNRQDWEMCERVQKGIATPAFDLRRTPTSKVCLSPLMIIISNR